MKCDGTHAETRFRLSAKRTSPFKSAGGRQFSRLLAARGVRISGSNAVYTMFRGSVKSSGYPLHSPVFPSLPLLASPCAITFQLESTFNKISFCLCSYHCLKYKSTVPYKQCAFSSESLQHSPGTNLVTL